MATGLTSLLLKKIDLKYQYQVIYSQCDGRHFLLIDLFWRYQGKT